MSVGELALGRLGKVTVRVAEIFEFRLCIRVSVRIGVFLVLRIFATGE